MVQVEALAAAGAITLAAALAYRAWAWRAGRLAGRAGHERAENPYVLYFTTETCGVCRTRQEPALAELAPVQVRKVDALAEPELARRYHVYTVPTTVVVGVEGLPLHVNYGYAPASRLRRQLAQA
jgi:thioredoxin-like negative regulator of GroEL